MSDVSQNRSAGILNLTIREKQALYMSYMPFLKNGGLFIPTKKIYQLGDEVYLFINLIDEPERIGVAAKVVWITPPQVSQANRIAGIGVQFVDQQIRSKIDMYLTGYKSDRPTYTL